MATAAPAPVAPPLALRIGAALLVVQVTAGIVVVLTGDRYGPGGRLFTAALIGLGYLFAHSAVRLRAGGALGALLLELSALLVALGARDWPSGARVAVGVSAVAVVVLVLASLPAFPSPDLPLR